MDISSAGTNSLLLATGCKNKISIFSCYDITSVAQLAFHAHSHYALDHNDPLGHSAYYHIHSTPGHSAHYHACSYQKNLQPLKP